MASKYEFTPKTGKIENQGVFGSMDSAPRVSERLPIEATEEALGPVTLSPELIAELDYMLNVKSLMPADLAEIDQDVREALFRELTQASDKEERKAILLRIADAARETVV